MKKLTAVVCAVALMLVVMTSAFAATSITEPTIVGVEGDEEIIVQEVTLEAIESETVKSIVEAVNDDETTEGEPMTVEKAVQALGVEVTEYDLSEYDFVTKFMEIVYTDGDEELYTDENGNPLSPTYTIQVDALKGEEDLSNYLIMVIQPDTSEVYFIELDKEENEFDPETGKLTVKFPTLGVFCLIQK